MRENTAEERRQIALEVNGKRSKSGKTTTPQWIESTEELIEQYREYAKRDLISRQITDDMSNEDRKKVKKIAEMYANLTTQSFEHDLPALLFFFRRYLTQH